MRTEQGVGLAMMLAAMCTAISAIGQNAASVATTSTDSGSRIFLASAGKASVPALLPGQLIRVIDDPNLGDRWLLSQNVDHPGGPGRLLFVSAQSPGKRSQPSGAQSANALEGGSALIHPVIRVGDRLIVEENSAVAEARLAAVALESATAGSAFNARLEIGGKVVRAVAVRTGQALLQPQIEVRR